MENRQRNKRGDGARLKEEVIEAAMRLLDRLPANALSLRNVAREAGVAAPSLYAHFADAETMTTEIVQECWRQVGEAMSRAGEACGAAAALDVLKAQMSAYVRYAMERPSRYQLLFVLPPADFDEPDNRGLLQPAFRATRQTIDSFVSGGGLLPADGPTAATLMTLSVVHGRIALAHLAPRRPGNSVASVQAFVADSLDRIFQPRRPAA